MGAGLGIDKLSGDADLATRLAHAALEHVANAKLASDLLDVDRLALVGEARIAGDDEQRPEPRQSRDDVLDETIDEVFLLRVAAHVLERQHGNRRLVGQGEGRSRRG